MPSSVVAFTDTYHPTVNGVTYVLDGLRDRYRDRGGRMDVVYPRSSHDPRDGEHPIRSVPFPFYDGFRVGLGGAPAVDPPDVVHLHSPMTVGLAGLRYAGRTDCPVVATYHTPIADYADYVPASGLAARFGRRYDGWFHDRVDLICTPSSAIRDRVDDAIDAEITVVPSGVDLDTFTPGTRLTARERLRDRGYDVPGGPLIGYTGRHGHEKRIGDLIDAIAGGYGTATDDAGQADGLDANVVIGGDGPARDALERRASEADTAAEISFLGFLDRDELPDFYRALDLFVFPSPAETQGMVAVEAMASGVPVVAADAGALVDTVDHDETGIRYPPGDVPALREAIGTAIDARDRLSETCLGRRNEWGIDRAVDRYMDVYERALADHC